MGSMEIVEGLFVVGVLGTCCSLLLGSHIRIIDADLSSMLDRQFDQNLLR